jgi:hypothetical protein
MHITKRILAHAAAATALAVATLLPGTAAAAIVSVHFSGTVSQASNLPSIDPSDPGPEFFQVGQKFSGDVSWDTADTGDTSSGSGTEFNLINFSIMIGGKDFSDRFLPRTLLTEPDGNAGFLSGGADQGGSAQLNFNLGSYTGSAPGAGDFAGKSGTFTYTDFYPLGGSVSGRAFVAGVPEPATWAMMMLGFGAIAGAARRRTPKAAIAL